MFLSFVYKTLYHEQIQIHCQGIKDISCFKGVVLANNVVLASAQILPSYMYICFNVSVKI